MIRFPRTLALTSAGILAVALASCTSTTPSQQTDSPTAGGYPVTITSCGVDYSYQSAPKRVLLGAPGMIATLDALGVADSAIGYTLSQYTVDGIDKFPGLTTTTADWTPSREFLISAQPDLFLSNDEQQLLGEGAATAADLAAIPANLYVLGDYCVDSAKQSTIDVVYNDVSNLGAIYGVPDAAADLVTSLRSRVDAVTAERTPGEKRIAGAITVSDGKVYALSGSYYAAVLDSLGLVNSFADLGSNWAEITPEAVLASNLDVILVTYSGGESQAAVAEAQRLFANAPAAKNNRIVGIDDTAFQSVGVAIVDVIEDTALQLAAH